MGLQRVRHYWPTSLSLFTFMHWRRKWQPTPVFLPGESQGQRSLVGFHLWGCTESDTTEWLHFHLSLSCIGEGNGNPFQCSCLENPRDGGACWAAVYGVTQSRTRLKWLSSSSSSAINYRCLHHCLPALSLVLRLGNYKAFRPAGCKPTSNKLKRTCFQNIGSILENWLYLHHSPFLSSVLGSCIIDREVLNGFRKNFGIVT